MRKIKIAVALLLTAGASMVFSSCIGSFAITKSVLKWNNSIGPKFVNELVFFAFWVLPVYEITGLADLVVVNSIEFWSGSNPMTASTKVVETDHGRYLIACDGRGYNVTNQTTGEEIRLDFEESSQTWSVETQEGNVPFMTFIDDTHVKMLTPDGSMTPVELTEQGMMAYAQTCGEPGLMAAR